MTPLLPPRGRSPHHFSVEFFEKQSSPHQNWKIGRGIPSPRFGAGIGNAPRPVMIRISQATVRVLVKRPLKIDGGGLVTLLQAY